MTELILRTAAVWVVLTLLFRVAGRRTMGELSPVEFVVLLVADGLVQEGLLGEDGSLTSGVLIIVVLLLTVGYSLLKLRVPAVSRVLEGVPTLLVRDGAPIPDRLRRSRVGLEDLLQVARENGVAELRGVRYAVLETDGRISIVPMVGPHPAADGDVRHKVATG